MVRQTLTLNGLLSDGILILALRQDGSVNPEPDVSPEINDSKVFLQR